MNIRHLRIFKTVCEEETLTKAAEKLFMTQPAVSNAIAELESHLGVTLFDRISRRIYLNEAGKMYLSKAVKLLDLYDDLENSKELVDEAPIKIGSSITIANFILPKAIVKFEGIYQNTPTKVNVGNAKTIEEMLCRNEIDVGLVEGVVNNDELVKIPFSSYEMAVICAPCHPLAGLQMLDINRLVQERLLLREKGSAIRDVFDSALLLHNIKVNPDWTSINSQALIHAVKEKLGISVLPRVLIENEIKSGDIIELKIHDFQLVNMNYILFHKNKFQTNSYKMLIEILKNNEI